jgi:hypothetical protein
LPQDSGTSAGQQNRINDEGYAPGSRVRSLTAITDIVRSNIHFPAHQLCGLRQMVKRVGAMPDFPLPSFFLLVCLFVMTYDIPLIYLLILMF